MLEMMIYMMKMRWETCCCLAVRRT